MAFPHGSLGADALDAAPPVSRLPFADPVTTHLLGGDPLGPLSLGAFPPSALPLPPSRLGFIDPATATAAASVVQTAVSTITSLFQKSTTDPASKIWKNISPAMNDVLTALNVRVGNDGKWYDATTNQLLSQEDADFRSESLMAKLVGAHMGSMTDRYWYDDLDNHKLTDSEAYTRWVQSYGQGATLESVLELGGSYVPQSVPNHATPEGVAYYGTPYKPTPSPGGKTGLATAGASGNTMLYVAGAAVLAALFFGRRKS